MPHSLPTPACANALGASAIGRRQNVTAALEKLAEISERVVLPRVGHDQYCVRGRFGSKQSGQACGTRHRDAEHALAGYRFEPFGPAGADGVPQPQAERPGHMSGVRWW